MSFHMQYSLGSMQLTKHTSSKYSKSVIRRGYESGANLESVVRSVVVPEDCSSDRMIFENCHTEDITYTEPSHHEIESKSNILGWNKIRKSLLTTFTESQCMAEDQVSVMVGCLTLAQVRCQEWGPGAYYCVQCFCDQHTRRNIFHTAEKWEEDHYVQIDCGQTKYVNGRFHNCADNKEVSLQCIDGHGREHTITFIHCGCESYVLSLVRAQLRPATPHYPKLVFTFSLLEWARALLFECRVSLKSFCSALNFPVKQKRYIYKSLIDCFEEYRVFKHEIQNLSFLSPRLDSGNICPACSKNEGVNIYSLDALFGLPRKKSAGHSHRPPLHGHLAFVDQAEVDDYVANNPSNHKGRQQECHNFLAGSMLRSSVRYHALDETALFGSACRHEFPAIFLNLKHGERLSYAVCMIKELQKKHDKVDMYVMYDVACMLQKHLEISENNGLLEKCRLCLPSFHCFGHKASCQIQYGPQRCDGVGLSDGEGMERLWSYLRHFGRMTKKMRPSHRVDVLTHVLLHYARKKKQKMNQSLVNRVLKAFKIKQVASEEFQKLTTNFSGGSVSEVDIQQWLKLESEIMTKEKPSTVPQWKINYFELLQSLFELREALLSGKKSSSKLGFYQEIIRLDKELTIIESKNKIGHRWGPSDREFLNLQSYFTSERTQQVLQALWSASSRRQFLLQLKAKYADGQKIAKKLAAQIGKETATIKNLVPQFNSCLEAQNGAEAKGLLIEEALDSTKLATLTSSSSFLSKEKQDIIGIYLRIKRSTEELSLLKLEMKNTQDYYARKQSVLKDLIEEHHLQGSSFGKGAVSLLQTLHDDVKEDLMKCTIDFSPFVHSTTENYCNYVEDEDCDSDDSDEDIENDNDII